MLLPCALVILSVEMWAMCPSPLAPVVIAARVVMLSCLLVCPVLSTVGIYASKRLVLAI